MLRALSRVLCVEGLCVAGLVWRAFVWALCWGVLLIFSFVFFEDLDGHVSTPERIPKCFFIMTLTL